MTDKATHTQGKKWYSNPLAKTVALALGVAGMAALVQLGAKLAGTDFNILSQGGGRGLLLGLTIAGICVLLALDRNSQIDYGLSCPRGPAKELMLGLAWGTGSYLAYIGAVLACGVCIPMPIMEWKPWLHGAFNGLAGIPLALTQQLIFGGYLWGIFRQAHGKATSMAAVAVIFGAIAALDSANGFLSPAHVSHIVGMTLTAALLVALRDRVGNILLPAGLLAGWILVRKVVRRIDLMHPLPGTLTDLLYPAGEPRQAPAAWLAIGLALACVLLWPKKQTAPAAVPMADPLADLKRYVPFSSPSLLAPLDVWFSALAKGGWKVGPAYIPRMLVAAAFSAINTLVSLPERLLIAALPRKKNLAPLFVLGVHRSGTTHLHNMLSLDPQFVTPRTYHIMNPNGCLFTGWVITPILGVFLPGKRPMDNVQFHLFSPQEEEFALMNMTSQSAYWGIAFPRSGAWFDRYILPQTLPAEERSRWQKNYQKFMHLLCFWTQRRPLLKNPYNTGRMGVLKEMYPRAKFIHLCRNPYAVWRSNRHMFKEAHPLIQLHDPPETGNYVDRFPRNYLAMEQAYQQAIPSLPAGDLTEVRFEDLERDPVGQIERIYAELGLEFSETFRGKLTAYLASVADYKKNKFDKAKETDPPHLWQQLAPLYTNFGYALPDAARAETSTGITSKAA